MTSNGLHHEKAPRASFSAKKSCAVRKSAAIADDAAAEINNSQKSSPHVSLTPRAQEKLVNRSLESNLEYVSQNHRGEPYLVTALDHLDKKLREDGELRERLQLPKDCVIHSFRHTFLTRFGEAGADAFTIKNVAGHSGVTISDRYIHATWEVQECAFERFANPNQTAVEKEENDAESYKFRYAQMATACKSKCPCSSTVRAADS